MGRTPITRQGAVEFGRRVRAYREKRGLTQLGLAIAIASADYSLDTSYISDIENGKRNPTLEKILILAAALDVDPCSLVKGLRPDPRP
jgi:transcriptional regulator with XRE-family HTH domain